MGVLCSLTILVQMPSIKQHPGMMPELRISLYIVTRKREGDLSVGSRGEAISAGQREEPAMIPYVLEPRMYLDSCIQCKKKVDEDIEVLNSLLSVFLLGFGIIQMTSRYMLLDASIKHINFFSKGMFFSHRFI